MSAEIATNGARSSDVYVVKLGFLHYKPVKRLLVAMGFDDPRVQYPSVSILTGIGASAWIPTAGRHSGFHPRMQEHL